MTVRIRESIYGSGYLRTLEVTLRVFPGVTVTGSNHPSNEPTPGLGEVRRAAELIRDQLRVWRPFTFRERTGARRSFRYEFLFRVDATDDPTPVNGWVSQLEEQPAMEVPSDHGRSVRSALEEARRNDCINVAVIPNTLLGYPRSSRLEDDDRFVRHDPRELHGYLEWAANAMLVGYDRLTSQGNQTAAHEMGHMFGLWHQPHESSIMHAAVRHPRQLREDDQAALHWSLENPRPGILWNHRVSGPLPITARGPMSLVYPLP